MASGAPSSPGAGKNLIQREAVATNTKKGKKKATAFAVASSVPSRT